MINMLRAFKSQIEYIKSDYKNRYIIHIISFLLFLILYIYCFIQKREFLDRSTGDNMLLTSYLVIYIITRIVLSGIGIPYEVLNVELIKKNLIIKQPLIGFDIEWLLVVRIFAMVIKSFIFNILSLILILIAGGFVYDINNYLALTLPVFTGTLFVTLIGYLLSSFLLYFDIKREFISLIQMGLIVLFITISTKDYYLLPFSIIKNQISGTIRSDILFNELNTYQILMLSWYWVAVSVLSILLIVIISYMVNVLYHKKEYRFIKKNMLLNK